MIYIPTLIRRLPADFLEFTQGCQSGIHVDKQAMEFCNTVMEKCCKSHGILLQNFSGNPVPFNFITVLDETLGNAPIIALDCVRIMLH